MVFPKFSLTRLAYFLVLLLAAYSPAAPAAEIRIGVLAWMGSEEAEVQWSPLLESLAQRLPAHHFSLRRLDLAGLAGALKRDEVDFVVTNPGHYVTLEAGYGITRIATQVAAAEKDPAHVVGSAVIVRAERVELRELQDLRRRTLAAVAPEAFGGYQVIWAELKERGINPENGDVKLHFTGMPMSRVVEAVARGDADAGVIRGCLLERLERDASVAAGQFRVLSPREGNPACRISSPRYPGWAFAATRKTPPELSREVLLTLLALPPDSGGQSWTVPADYHPVHDMLRRLEIGPYAFLRETAWQSLAHRYWPAAAIVAALLLFWLSYTLRVEHLVQRRTSELSAALAERESLESRVREGQQQMDHLSRLSILGELAGNLAHELNQPLATIGNYARSLTRRLERGNLSADALSQAALEIAQESERAAAILAGIRAFARKRVRARELRDMAELAQEAIGLFQGMLAQTQELQLVDQLPPDKRRFLVDPQQIQQVFLNLLKNASDAHQAGGVNAPIRIILSAEPGHCVVAVTDRGPGLAQAQREHLFEAFFTTKPDGLGLGLSICKTIVEAHGGELSAEFADPGPGMIFRFTLPMPDNPENVPAC